MRAEDLTHRLRAVKLVVLDVDGVLTDGRLGYSDDGHHSHAFHVRDGLALVEAHRAGLTVAAISGRRSTEVARRLRELRVSHIEQGSGDKVHSLQRLWGRLSLSGPDTTFMGDDVNDLGAMAECGLAVTVADADPQVRERVAAMGGWVLTRHGGHGAARELIQAVLTAQGRWPWS